MRKTKVIFSVLAALCLMAFSAQAASAQQILPGAGSTFSGDNTGPAAGAHVFTAFAGNLRVTCTTVRNTGTVLAPVPPATKATRANARMNYSGCTFRIGGITAPATVSTPCDWTATITSFTALSGASAGTLSTNCNSVITVGSVNCTITIPPVTVPITGQNYNAGHMPTPPNAGPPVNLLLTANVSGLPWTSSAGCQALGIPAQGSDGTYTGRKYERGIWVAV